MQQRRFSCLLTSFGVSKKVNKSSMERAKGSRGWPEVRTPRRLNQQCKPLRKAGMQCALFMAWQSNPREGLDARVWRHETVNGNYKLATLSSLRGRNTTKPGVICHQIIFNHESLFISEVFQSILSSLEESFRGYLIPCQIGHKVNLRTIMILC